MIVKSRQRKKDKGEWQWRAEPEKQLQWDKKDRYVLEEEGPKRATLRKMTTVMDRTFLGHLN